MTSSAKKIEKILVRSVNSTTGELEEKKVACSSFWKDGPCVIIFFRRFGCHICRLTAKELSEQLKPILDQNKIRLIGIGFDARFVRPFVQEGFFKGELYIDTDLECYNALQYKRYSYLDLMMSMMSTKWLEIFKQITAKGIKGNLTEGDGFQSGGTLVVDKNGKIVLEFRQDNVSDMISSEQILKALELKQN